MSAQTYRAIVTREGKDWLADVPALEGAHTFARTLPKLMQYVREVIVLAEDLPDGAMKDLDIDFVYRTSDPDIDRVVQKVRRDRVKIAKAEKTLRSSCRAGTPSETDRRVCDVQAPGRAGGGLVV